MCTISVCCCRILQWACVVSDGFVTVARHARNRPSHLSVYGLSSRPHMHSDVVLPSQLSWTTRIQTSFSVQFISRTRLLQPLRLLYFKVARQLLFRRNWMTPVKCHDSIYRRTLGVLYMYIIVLRTRFKILLCSPPCRGGGINCWTPPVRPSVLCLWFSQNRKARNF